MGLFDRFKQRSAGPAAKTAQPRSDGAVLTQLAQLISCGDEAVLREIEHCTGDPRSWFESHRSQYEERGVDTADDLKLVEWLGLVDSLAAHGWVCERDWKDELEDFLFFLQTLKGYQSLQLPLDPAWFTADGDIPAWCDILAAKWAARGVRVAAMDIDSDSYVLFPVLTAQLPALQKLASEIGRQIEFVESM